MADAASGIKDIAEGCGDFGDYAAIAGAALGGLPGRPGRRGGNNSPQNGIVSDGFDRPNNSPKPSYEDITTGPHGPDRSIEDVISRGRIPNPDGTLPAQGRWLSREAGERAVSNLDTSQMPVGQPFSVPIEPNSGVVVRPFNEYPPTGTPPSQRYISEQADRALTIQRRDGSIHTFPIGPEHPSYNTPAPTRGS